MRNAASHARFYVHDDGAQQGQIREIEFKAGDEPGDFHLKMPRENVEKFVRKLADSALENIKPE
jgi:hypothetical protein